MKTNRLKSILTRFFKEYSNILGTIIIALEGVNVNLSGDQDDLYKLLNIFTKEGFDVTTAKFNKTQQHSFGKIKISIKPEISALKNKDLQVRINKLDGDKVCKIKDNIEVLNSLKWDSFLQDDKNIVLDIRNNYEHTKGVFKGKSIVQPNVVNFHETIDWLEKNKTLLSKYKNIGMYCTGGIRCEKLSFYLAFNGYKNLVLLKGGIIQYLNDKKGDNKKPVNWKGDCFVFDDRITLNS